MCGDIFCDPRGASFLVGRSVRTLQRWREQTKEGTPVGPSWHEIRTVARGAAVYDVAEIAEWVLGSRDATNADTPGQSRDSSDIDIGAPVAET